MAHCDAIRRAFERPLRVRPSQVVSKTLAPTAPPEPRSAVERFVVQPIGIDAQLLDRRAATNREPWAFPTENADRGVAAWGVERVDGSCAHAAWGASRARRDGEQRGARGALRPDAARGTSSGTRPGALPRRGDVFALTSAIERSHGVRRGDGDGTACVALLVRAARTEPRARRDRRTGVLVSSEAAAGALAGGRDGDAGEQLGTRCGACGGCSRRRATRRSWSSVHVRAVASGRASAIKGQST